MPDWNDERRRLTADLIAEGGDRLAGMPAWRLLDLELVFTLFLDHLPGEDLEEGWAVLTGYPFPALESRSDAARRAIDLARFHLREIPGRESWKRHLEQYRALPAPLPAFRVQSGGVESLSTPVAPDRLAVMREALRTPPAPLLRPASYAGPGRYRFTVAREPHEVTIAEAAAACADRAIPQLPPAGPRRRSPLRVNLDDLRQTARWMDASLPVDFRSANTWESRLARFDLQLAGPDGFVDGDALTLDGLLHLIGMVGSGKSSLLTVLTVHLARQGLRVVLLLGDVASLLNELALFDALQPIDPTLTAVPLVGRTTRSLHLNRLHARMGANGHGNSPLRVEHPAFALLSTICPLNGRIADGEPFPPGEEPCTRLQPIRSRSLRRDCPYLPVCPVHEATRRVPEARVWLATPASLLASRPQAPLIPRQAAFAELVMEHADVVLVDEADLVQVQFDDHFAPTEVLVGTRNGWLDDLAARVPDQVYAPARPLIGTSEDLSAWHVAHDQAQQAANHLLHHLRDRSGEPRRWVGRRHFTATRLLWRLGREMLPTATGREQYETACQAVSSRGLSPGNRAAGTDVPEEWINSMRALLTDGDPEAAAAQLRVWWLGLGAVPANRVNGATQKLLICLITAVLEGALYRVLSRWKAAEEVLQLSRGAGGMFDSTSERLRRCVPEPAMGAALGFQYYRHEESGRDELRFFRAHGVGRSLLYHLHDRLSASHETDGPHVVLTSGTSWAPRSWKYHLHQPPTALLVPKEPYRVGAIQCAFEPLPDPANPQEVLYVSGLEPPERHRNLEAIVDGLARPRTNGPSLLEAELARLPEGRRRLLLVVGSYEEAQLTGRRLITALGGDESDVRILVPDSRGDDEEPGVFELLRGLLDRFPQTGARFIVAPLQAIERGHNILVEEQAAIGSAFFLVRPFPPPGDLPTAFQRINAWVAHEVPRLTGMGAGAAGARLRSRASRLWDQLLVEEQRYRTMDDRGPLLWTQIVLVWQCIGRLLRGGVSARAVFVDAQWANVSAGRLEGSHDSEATSMLMGFRRILREALADPDPVQRVIAEQLYGPFAAGLENVEGVCYE